MLATSMTCVGGMRARDARFVSRMKNDNKKQNGVAPSVRTATTTRRVVTYAGKKSARKAGGGAPKTGGGGGGGGGGGASSGKYKSPGEVKEGSAYQTETRKIILSMSKVRKVTSNGKELIKNINLGMYLGAKIGILGRTVRVSRR